MRALGWLGIVGVLLGGCRDRCAADYGYTWLEIGVGSRDYIEVPYGEQVSPDSAPGAADPFFNVALRGFGIPRSNLAVELEALVDDVPYAFARHEGVGMTCRAGQLEVGGLRMFLDPLDLPPQTRPDREGRGNPRVEPVFDSGWDSGWHTGRPLAWKVDVQVRATVLDASEVLTRGETWWFVYR